VAGTALYCGFGDVRCRLLRQLARRAGVGGRKTDRGLPRAWRATARPGAVDEGIRLRVVSTPARRKLMSLPPRSHRRRATLALSSDGLCSDSISIDSNYYQGKPVSPDVAGRATPSSAMLAAQRSDVRGGSAETETPCVMDRSLARRRSGNRPQAHDEADDRGRHVTLYRTLRSNWARRLISSPRIAPSRG